MVTASFPEVVEMAGRPAGEEASAESRERERKLYGPFKV